jgi:hypothetical protein
MALGATVALGLFVGSQVEVTRCRSQGGRVLHYGLDHACTRADGSTVPITVLPSARGPQAAIVVGALATAGAIYLGLLRIVKPGRRPA